MPTCVITPVAEEEVRSILAYLSEVAGSEVATRVRQRFRDTFRRIGRAPAIGHRRKDLSDDDILFYRLHSYFIIYDATTRPVRVIRVIHVARDVRALLGDE